MGLSTIERVFDIVRLRAPGPPTRLALEQKDPESYTDEELDLAIDEAEAAIAAIRRNQLRLVRVRDRRRLWERDGCRNMGQWLSGRLGISAFAGMRWTHAAHALEHLPLTSAAFERGSISFDKVLQLARFATADSEKELLRYARRASVSTA